MKKYKCPHCEHICTEEDFECEEIVHEGKEHEESFCDTICPSCNAWNDMDDWELVE